MISLGLGISSNEPLYMENFDLPPDFYRSFWSLGKAGKDMVYTVMVHGMTLEDYAELRGLSKGQVSRIIETIRVAVKKQEFVNIDKGQ